MSKRQYDLIFGLGAACSCTQGLRAAGLQHLSFPFDWIGGLSFSNVAKMIADGCTDVLSDESALKLLPDAPGSNESHWVDTRNGLLYYHDFYKNKTLREQFDAARAKYVRRAKRLNEVLTESKRVLLVWTETPDVSPEANMEELMKGREIMQRRYPGAEFDVLWISPKIGVSVDQPEVTEDGPVRIVSFNYWNKKLFGMMMGDGEVLGRFLVREYAVRDYRTPQERHNEARVRRQRYYRRLRATTYWEYLVNSFQYRSYKHLLKVLSRKGIV